MTTEKTCLSCRWWIKDIPTQTLGIKLNRCDYDDPMAPVILSPPSTFGCIHHEPKEKEDEQS